MTVAGTWTGWYRTIRRDHLGCHVSKWKPIRHGEQTTWQAAEIATKKVLDAKVNPNTKDT